MSEGEKLALLDGHTVNATTDDDAQEASSDVSMMCVLSRVGMLAVMATIFVNAFSDPKALSELTEDDSLFEFYQVIGETFLGANKAAIVFQILFMLGMGRFWWHELTDTEEDIIPELPCDGKRVAVQSAVGVSCALPVYVTLNGGQWSIVSAASVGVIVAAGCSTFFFAQLYGSFLALAVNEKDIFVSKKFLHDHDAEEEGASTALLRYTKKDFLVRWLIFTTFTAVPQLIISSDAGAISAYFFALYGAALESAYHASHDVVAGDMLTRWRQLAGRDKAKAVAFAVSHGFMAISTTVMFANRLSEEASTKNSVFLALSIVGMLAEFRASAKEAMIHAGEHHHHQKDTKMLQRV